MTDPVPSKGVLLIAAILALGTACAAAIVGGGVSSSDGPTAQSDNEARKLSHAETLQWIAEHRAWRLARKTQAIWARPVEAEEVDKEFQTADHVKEVARKGVWLCVGGAGEPWFQSLEKIEAKYEPGGEESRRFDFDQAPRTYRQFRPRGTVRNWAAQVKGPGIEGFSIRPGYDPERPLYSPAGGYVLKPEVGDPYRDDPKDVWLVQEPLFESTYELVPNPEPKGG